MTEGNFKPIVYVKAGCPFCLKVRIMLLETGLLDKTEIREFEPGSDLEQAIRAEITPHLEKISFPAAQIAVGHFLSDSDAIVGHFAEGVKVDPATLPTLNAYIEGPFKQLGQLFMENIELKKQLAGNSPA